MRINRLSFVGAALAAIVCTAGLSTCLLGQSPAERQPLRERIRLRQPVLRVAQQPAQAATQSAGQQATQPAVGSDTAQPGEHPLEPALQIARKTLEHIERDIKDYTCMMAKRERVGGKLLEQEIMFLKVRHQPFSVYIYFMAPAAKKGQEAIYVEGLNDGKLWGHGVGIRKIAGTVSLKPDSMLAMQDQRYPITEIGILNLSRRLIEVAEQDKQYGECEVKFFRNAKIDGRACTCLQVVHPVPRKNFRFHMAQVFIDDEWNVPVRYVAFDWPDKEGGKPVLLEEYTYYKLKFNVGLTDADFQTSNPKYGFN